MNNKKTVLNNELEIKSVIILLLFVFHKKLVRNKFVKCGRSIYLFSRALNSCVKGQHLFVYENANEMTPENRC